METPCWCVTPTGAADEEYKILSQKRKDGNPLLVFTPTGADECLHQQGQQMNNIQSSHKNERN
jgi:hypothetical protein